MARMDGTRRVGELAAATGLTVRTLHHWEDVGLLVPARSEAGHRLYSPSHVRRLYGIVALRRLGLPLDEIRGVIDGGADLAGAVRTQLAELDHELEQLRSLRDRVMRIAAELDRGVDPSDGDLIDLIEVMTMSERYYTPEQLHRLEERRHELGDDGIRDAEREWTELIAAVEGHKARGDDPEGPEMRAVAARWRELIEKFAGGDPGIRDSLARMYREEGAEQASRSAVSPELMAYVGRALAAG